MSVTAAQGFRAAGVRAGLKASGKPDLALVVNDGPLDTAAGVFTTNRVVAAPVVWSRRLLAGQEGGQPGGIEESGGDTGLDGQGDGGDVAAGDGDAPGGCQLLALGVGSSLAVVQELGHPVGPGAGVVRAVVGLPRLLTGQAVVRAAVDE